MGKRIITLYAEDDDIELAKTKGVNLSSFFREALRVEMGIKELSDTTTKEELITKLKNKLALMTDELRVQTEKSQSFEKEIKELQRELEKERKRKKSVDEDEVRIL